MYTDADCDAPPGEESSASDACVRPSSSATVPLAKLNVDAL